MSKPTNKMKKTQIITYDEVMREIKRQKAEIAEIWELCRQREILLRTFPPFSDPVPYSHEQEPGCDEWREDDDCQGCPYHRRWTDGKNIRGIFGCEFFDPWNPHQEWCRFTEYRHILFRRHDDVMGGE